MAQSPPLPPRQFIDARDTLVTDAIDGLLRSSGGALARLEGEPGIKVVLRADRRADRVALIAGGGSGHEPAHAGFVGKGMLTAAVCGEVFASPSIDAVFAAIMAVTGPAGALVIVKNYTGDRLNFGLAVERARALGRRVEVVIVRDDIALPDLPQPRGLAGAVFVEKVAGYYAERGASLKTVAAMAQQAADGLVSLGLALSSCTLPGIGREDRVPAGMAELGLGLHGEPGIELVPFEGARQAARLLAERLFAAVRPAPGYALLLNNLGSTTPLEMSLLAQALLAGPQGRKVKLLLGPAMLVSSLDMHGVSCSLLPLTPAFAAALRAPAGAAAWPGVRVPAPPRREKLPREMRRRAAKPSADPALRALLERACAILIEAEPALNALDARVGDGDTGSTVAAGARQVLAALPGLPLARLDLALAAIGEVLGRSMGGSSGVLLAIFCAAAGQAVAAGAAWPAALAAGQARMMAYGGAAPGDRTLLDALAPALAALPQGLPAAARAARRGAEATAAMGKARAGRSSYLAAATLAGHVDPGAEAVARLLEGLAAAAG